MILQVSEPEYALLSTTRRHTRIGAHTTMTMTTPEPRGHAIVIGASMGGLAAAAALAGHFEYVTILDRDDLPTTARHRRAVPQGRHAHGLQPGGLRALETLLPGLGERLATGGAPSGDLGIDCSWTVGGNRFARSHLGAVGIGVTRPFLEQTVRTCVAELPTVSIRDGVDVTGLVSCSPGRVSGVRIDIAGASSELHADLVVDTCGKVSRLATWLGELGYDVPEEETVRCSMAYLSRRWRLDPARRPTDIVTVVTPAEHPTFGVMIAQEDGTHVVTLGALLGLGPARDDDAYREFALSLPDQAIADALVDATPVTDLQPAHFPASRRRRYDRMRRFPAGVIPLGDAIAAFNPMYGQGMTVAALEAVTLRELLAAGPLRPRRYLAAAHRVEDAAWKISTGGDLAWDGVEGRRTPDVAVINRYLARLKVAARTDAVLAGEFLRVAGFLQRPQTLFAPSTMWRVLRPRRRKAQVVPVGLPPVPAGPASALQRPEGSGASASLERVCELGSHACSRPPRRHGTQGWTTRSWRPRPTATRHW